MKKTIKLQDLECANCAAKIETAVAKLEGVIEVKVNFMSQKMILDAPDDRFDTILEAVKKIIRKIEPDVVMIV